MSTGLILRRFFGTLIALLLVVIASGCAHPISLMGNTDALIGAGKVKLDHAVGLAISLKFLANLPPSSRIFQSLSL